jgi:hypothetical protein
MDHSGSIADDHLGAALARWEESARCAAYIFGDALGDPIAEKILAVLRSVPGGLTRTEIREQVFQRNVAATRIKAALALLLRNHLIREGRDDATGGRPACRATPSANTLGFTNQRCRSSCTARAGCR